MNERAAPRKPQLELPEDRPASFDEAGHHVALNPASVTGRFRKYRDWFYLLLIVVFLALPWTKIGGEQTILIDLPNRRFALFGITFWAHDVPLLFFILGLLTVGLAFVTVTLGRVWCGWACPQTVFIDRIYRRIESWIEGDHIRRARLARAPMSWEKLWKRSLKWFLFWFVSANIAHSFSAYFIGAERLVEMSLAHPQEAWTAFIFVTSLTAILMFDFGWFREQFCMIMCPYGRFQSVLMDRHSLAILYDEKRGEPRKGTERDGAGHGDCVNCYRCVAVCPTGVDIRRGVQMECVACTACIDACDEIMHKVERPKGLIRYASEATIGGGKSRFWRPASIIYASILALLAVGLLISVASRGVLDVKFIRAVDTPYTQNRLDDGTSQIINHYTVTLQNQTFGTQEVSLELPAAALDRGVDLVAPTFPLSMEGGERVKQHVFFKFPGDLTGGTGKFGIRVRVRSSAGNEIHVLEETISLVGPIS